LSREVLEALHRPGLRAKFPQIGQLDVTRIITLCAQAQVIEPSYVPSVARDPDDDKFLACARSAAADYLVTEDKDLLVLESYKGSRICQTAGFISLLEGDSTHAG
jgi:putative PIN family toxin of toxin-antitoxin system